MSGSCRHWFRCLLLTCSLASCSSKDDDAAGSSGKGNTANPGASGSSNPTPGKGDGGSTGAGGPPTTSGDTFGEARSGVYHLGPVDFAETQWHNACAPAGGYRPVLHESVGLGGEFLAAVANEHAQAGGVCDACILIETGEGKSIVARVVTYGVQHAAGDIDVSPNVFEAIHQGENPRSMTWRFARCPEVGGFQYEFQAAANVYWSSLWLRNPRVPLTKLEVKSKNHPDFVALARGTDGTLTEASGFGEGAFTLRATSLDGQTVTEELPGFTPGTLVASDRQFD